MPSKAISSRTSPRVGWSVVLVVGFDLPVKHLRDGSFLPVRLGLGGVLSNLLTVQNLTQTDAVMATLRVDPISLSSQASLAHSIGPP